MQYQLGKHPEHNDHMRALPYANDSNLRMAHRAVGISGRGAGRRPSTRIRAAARATLPCKNSSNLTDMPHQLGICPEHNDSMHALP